MEATESQTSTTEPAEGSTETINRPDNIPEKFWDTSAGSANVDALAEAYTSLEKKMFTKNEVLREELSNERLAGRPEDLSKYTPPETEGVEWTDNDPLLSFWREQSFEMGLNNDQFQNGVMAYVKAQQDASPNIEAEMAKLGEDAQTRVDAVKAWSDNLTSETQQQLSRIANTAEGLIAVEELMASASKSASVVNDQSIEATPKTIQELQQAMNSPEYWDPARRNPKLIEEITNGFAQLAR